MRTFANHNYIVLIVAVLLVGGAFVAISTQQSTRPGQDAITYAPGTFVNGVSYGEWGARDWQRTLSFPLGLNPGHDATGSACGTGQSGPVFFLSHNYAPCTVPTGVALYIPVAAVECSTRDRSPFSGTDEDQLRDCAAREADRYTNIRVSVDGQDVASIEMYRATTPLFAAALPEHNILGAPAGMAYVVADGYPIILKPLEPGEHQIVVHLELTDGIVLPDKLIHVTVVEPTFSTPDSDVIFATPEG